MSKWNENRLGYKKTTIGWIPDEWEVKPLGAFGSFSKGKGISNSEKKESGIPCITYGEIYTRYDFVIKGFYSFIAIETAKMSQRIKKNTILFAGSGETLDEIGKCVAYMEEIEAYVGGDIIIFNPEGVNSIYLSYSLNSDLLIRHKKKLGQGHSVVHIYSSGLKKLHVPLPHLPEQKKIVEILSVWDRAIEQVGKLIDTKQRLKNGLMQQLLTGRIRFQKFNHKRHERHENKKGEPPEEWQKVKIKEICKLGRGRVISKDEIAVNSGSYPVYSSQTQNGGEMGKISTFDFDGELVTWTTDGVNAGTVFYRVGKFNCTNVCGTLEKQRKDVNMRFLAYRLSIEAYKHVSVNLANPKLMNKEMGNVKISIPHLSEQTRIAAVLSTCDREIELLRRKEIDLREQKKGLMQKLLTGEVRAKL